MNRKDLFSCSFDDQVQLFKNFKENEFRRNSKPRWAYNKNRRLIYTNRFLPQANNIVYCQDKANIFRAVPFSEFVVVAEYWKQTNNKSGSIETAMFLLHTPSNEVYELLDSSNNIECLAKKIEEDPVARIEKIKEFKCYEINDCEFRKVKITEILKL